MKIVNLRKILSFKNLCIKAKTKISSLFLDVNQNQNREIFYNESYQDKFNNNKKAVMIYNLLKNQGININLIGVNSYMLLEKTGEQNYVKEYINRRKTFGRNKGCNSQKQPNRRF